MDSAGYGDYDQPDYGGWSSEYGFDADDVGPGDGPGCDIDFAHLRFLSLFHDAAGSDGFDPEWGGHFTDPEMDQAARWFDCDADELHEMFRAVLFLRGWRLARRTPWPALTLLLRLLADLIPEAEPDATGPLGADRRPAADLSPPVVFLRARSVLTCAPPARVPCPAGATG